MYFGLADTREIRTLAERKSGVTAKRALHVIIDASNSRPMELKLSVSLEGKALYWTDHGNICRTLIVHMEPAQYQKDTGKDQYQERV